MTYQVTKQIASGQLLLPQQAQLEHWVKLSLQRFMPRAEVVIRFTDEAEMTTLNHRYRNKIGVTNILSFPFAGELPKGPPLLGDLVICAPRVEQEAHQQAKTLEAHYAHLVIHGLLHLLGYDHELAPDAEIMEQQEIQILTELGYNNPYKELEIT